MEIKNIKSEQIGEPIHSVDRAVWLRKYRFDKVKVFRDANGEIVQHRAEVPFSEIVYSLFVVGNKKSIWVKEDLLFSLKEVLADLELVEGDSPSPSSFVSGGDEIVLAVGRVKNGGDEE